MKTAGVVLLVLVLLLVGLPLAMGIDMGTGMDADGHCPSCAPDGPISLAMCLAVLSLFALTLRVTSSKILFAKATHLRATSLISLYRPPRTI